MPKASNHLGGKSYAPWARAWQTQLESHLMRAWRNHPIGRPRFSAATWHSKIHLPCEGRDTSATRNGKARSNLSATCTLLSKLGILLPAGRNHKGAAVLLIMVPSLSHRQRSIESGSDS
jgi:hypothetical protein